MDNHNGDWGYDSPGMALPKNRPKTTPTTICRPACFLATGNERTRLHIRQDLQSAKHLVCFTSSDWESLKYQQRLTIGTVFIIYLIVVQDSPFAD